MIIIAGFMHQVEVSPHDGKYSHTPSVFVADEYADAHQAHNHEKGIHPEGWERLDKIKTDKIKCKFGRKDAVFYIAG